MQSDVADGTERSRLPATTRERALELAGQCRFDEARALLEGAVKQPGAPRLELLGDLAAVALRAGDLVQAIVLARHVVGALPEDDLAGFTLAMGLSAIGSYGEALERLGELTAGVRGERFRTRAPGLAGLAATEAARLDTLASAAASVAPRARAASSEKYELSHLIQSAEQTVSGPIQDDEALLLYALVRSMRLRRILELGGLSGYSARNFLKALTADVDTAVYSVDLNPVPSQAKNHYTLCKDATRLTGADLHDRPVDLLFFDCHVLEAQMSTYERLVASGLVTDRTIVALHDTGLHPQKYGEWCYGVREADGTFGYVHQQVERRMVNLLHDRYGYEAFCVHVDPLRNDERLPFRHGLTLMRKFRALAV